MLLNFFRNRNICNQGGPHYILLMIKGTCENGPKSFPTDLQTLWGGQLVTLPTVAKEILSVYPQNCSNVMAGHPLLARKETILVHTTFHLKTPQRL
jgi:hypothetical protein